jgi:hypothetical protein
MFELNYRIIAHLLLLWLALIGFIVYGFAIGFIGNFYDFVFYFGFLLTVAIPRFLMIIIVSILNVAIIFYTLAVFRYWGLKFLVYNIWLFFLYVFYFVLYKGYFDFYELYHFNLRLGYVGPDFKFVLILFFNIQFIIEMIFRSNPSKNKSSTGK